MAAKVPRSLSLLAGLAMIAGPAGCEFDNVAPESGNKGLVAFDVAAPVDTADNAHLHQLTATVDAAFRAINASVTFTTTLGAFATGNSSTVGIVDSLGVARAFLRAPQDSAIAHVTAAVAGTSITREILFLPAFPTRVLVTAASPVVAAKVGSTADVTAAFVRDRGTVTTGGSVSFDTSSPSNSRLSVRVTPDSAIATGPSSVTKLVVLGTDTGTVYVRATYRRDGRSLTDSVRVHILTTGS